MAASNLITLAEPPRMTLADGLAFVERTRRQLDRFSELPHRPGASIAPDDEASIRKICDELEADIHGLLAVP